MITAHAFRYLPVQAELWFTGASYVNIRVIDILINLFVLSYMCYDNERWKKLHFFFSFLKENIFIWSLIFF